MFLLLCINICKVFQKVSVIKRETAYLSLCVKMPFYAVAKGRAPGVFMTWADCESQVKGFSGARYKKFDTIELAQTFVSSEGGIGITKQKQNVSNFNNPNSTRSFSTSSSIHQKKVNNVIETNKKSKRPAENHDNFDSDSSDDLNTILTKQMDDIEERLKSYTKGVDNIIKSSMKAPKKAILLEVSQPKRRRSADMQFEKDADGYVKVYTDGACSGNGRSGAKAGYGVYWADGHSLNTSEPVEGRATNNCGEIQAANHAISQALQNGIKQLAVYTDSQFLINSVTKWMSGWKRKGWKLKNGEPVKNVSEFKELDKLQSKIALKWVYVEAHRGIHGNEMADQLAKAGAARYSAQ